jgi:hypothetical protein
MKTTLSLIVVSILTLTSCSSSGDETNVNLETNTDNTIQEISIEDFGEKWPFTVDKGVLKCDGAAVTFSVEGKVYPVNGVASQKTVYQLEDIWAYDDKMIQEFIDAGMNEAEIQPKPRKSIAPIIDAGLELCN